MPFKYADQFPGAGFCPVGTSRKGILFALDARIRPSAASGIMPMAKTAQDAWEGWGNIRFSMFSFLCMARP